MPQVGTREINNIEVEVHASPHGTWTIYLVGDAPANERHLAGNEDTLDKAVNKARIAIKKQQVKVAVPFKTADGKSGIATGRHARARSKVLTEIAGKKEQLDSHAKVLKHDTPKDVVDHIKDLDEEIRKLERERRELWNEWKLDLGANVDQAVKEAVEEQEAA